MIMCRLVAFLPHTILFIPFGVPSLIWSCHRIEQKGMTETGGSGAPFQPEQQEQKRPQ